MIRDLKPYPAYKDSGVPWLGEVPEHWAMERAKWLFRKMDRPVQQDDCVVTCFRDGVVTLRKNRRERGFTESLKEIGYQGVRQGDLVIHAMDAFAGAVGISDSDGKCTPVYSVCQPVAQVKAHYYAYIVREMARTQWIAALAKGIRERSTDFRYAEFASQLLPLPPLPEQTAIVRFLDFADRRIRRSIHAKRKLNTLLNEQKQAIINHAVTRGLDPDVPLKDSGVEWLGEVPEHWEVLRTRYLFYEVDRRSETGNETHLSMSQKLGLVPSTMVDQKTLLSVSYTGGKLCEVDDLVLNRLKAHLGVFALAKQNGVISPDYTVFRKRRPLLMEYFEHVLRAPACRGELRIRAKGIVQGFWRLYTDDFYDIRLPVPPITEQQVIVNAIREGTQRIKVATEALEREIDLLLEYRTRLIADVVTGKIDVRVTAASLPKEVEEPEPLDEAGDLSEADEPTEGADIEIATGEVEA